MIAGLAANSPPLLDTREINDLRAGLSLRATIGRGTS